jgi:hypothetical protein
MDWDKIPMPRQQARRFHGKARRQRIDRRVGEHMGGIEVEFAPPDQAGLLTLLDNSIEEAAKHFHPVARADARQARMVGQRFIQIEPQVPAHTQAVGSMTQQLAFRANPLKEHDQLELEEDFWINACSSSPGRIAVLDEVAHACQATIVDRSIWTTK